MTAVKFNSVCSGIEAASHAVAPLGWKAVAFSEIEPNACAFLADRYPHVQNVGDMLAVDWSRPRYHANVLIGGTPCQSFSVLGAWRKGDGAKEVLGDKDDRGKLAYHFIDIADESDCDWFLWENVPNVTSANEGKFFKKWLRKAREHGFNVGWRVLDTEDFGLPALRKRLYAVGHRGPAAEIERVLFQPGNTRGRSLPADAQIPGSGKRQDRRDGIVGADSIVVFDAASIKPRASSTAFNTFLKSHATRVGVAWGAGGRGGPYRGEPGFVRKATAEEAELAMGFSRSYTDAGGLDERRRHEMIGNSFSPVVINAICEGIDEYYGSDSAFMRND